MIRHFVADEYVKDVFQIDLVKLKNEGKKVMLVAGDTFRAGAVEQLKTWAERTKCDIVYDETTADPASVVYQGLEKAKNENYDLVLIDTAGRLQNKTNLMKELEKMNRVINKEVEGAPHETLLVIDATTGQNGMSQAEAFGEITNITGVILTKLDGTSKGGIVLAIRDKYNLPIKFIGLGEKMDDLEYFDLEDDVYTLNEKGEAKIQEWLESLIDENPYINLNFNDQSTTKIFPLVQEDTMRKRRKCYEFFSEWYEAGKQLCRY